jgi:putative membrane protein
MRCTTIANGAASALIVRARIMSRASREAAAGAVPLADQQLAGLLMWVPAILPYLGVGLWLAWSSLRPGEPAR